MRELRIACAREVLGGAPHCSRSKIVLTALLAKLAANSSFRVSTALPHPGDRLQGSSESEASATPKLGTSQRSMARSSRSSCEALPSDSQAGRGVSAVDMATAGGESGGEGRSAAHLPQGRPSVEDLDEEIAESASPRGAGEVAGSVVQAGAVPRSKEIGSGQTALASEPAACPTGGTSANGQPAA